MALTIVNVQGSRQILSEGWQDTFLFVPGSSDYVTNGYVVTAIATGFKAIQAAWLSGANAAAVPGSAARWAAPIFVIAELGSGGQGFTGYSQFLWKVIVSSTGAESGSGDNLTGYIWQVTIQGY